MTGFKASFGTETCNNCSVFLIRLGFTIAIAVVQQLVAVTVVA
jgi:hypothetical protein